MLTTKLNGVQPNINTFVISEAIVSSGASLKQSLTYSIERTGSKYLKSPGTTAESDDRGFKSYWRQMEFLANSQLNLTWLIILL